MEVSMVFRRNKVMNFFSLMLRKRMRGDEADGEVEDPEEKKSKATKSKGNIHH